MLSSVSFCCVWRSARLLKMEAVFTKALFKLAINDIKVPMKLYKLILNLFHRSEKFAQHNIQKLLLADFCTEKWSKKSWKTSWESICAEILFKSRSTSVLIIQKIFHWFDVQVDWLISIRLGHWSLIG